MKIELTIYEMKRMLYDWSTPRTLADEKIKNKLKEIVEKEESHDRERNND